MRSEIEGMGCAWVQMCCRYTHACRITLPLSQPLHSPAANETNESRAASVAKRWVASNAWCWVGRG